jgi:hypothetical protein
MPAPDEDAAINFHGQPFERHRKVKSEAPWSRECELHDDLEAVGGAQRLELPRQMFGGLLTACVRTR